MAGSVSAGLLIHPFLAVITRRLLSIGMFISGALL